VSGIGGAANVLAWLLVPADGENSSIAAPHQHHVIPLLA
jgi:hypothetical protein